MEEMFFRGAVLKLLSKGGAVYSILVSSLFFALFHNSIHHFLWPFLAGLIYGFMAVTFKSVWPSIFAHTVNNLFSYFAYGVLLHFKQDNGLIIVLSIIIVIFLILTFTGLSQYQELLAYEGSRRKCDKAEIILQRRFALTTFFSIPVIAVMAIYIHTALW
ncbi:hypothetical protein SDC9_130092 [bioreactor metagenome]|uniref:CAAX prenyl protease 2/Lysostaphin resistance protein A-like domain-containing protein n=1 Tax=bioreactor metagenome TaxID=1076179 RepID=A0A645D1I4_9ZZZZ